MTLSAVCSGLTGPVAQLIASPTADQGGTTVVRSRPGSILS